MFGICIVFTYVDSDFPPYSLSLLFTFPLLYGDALSCAILKLNIESGENHTPLQGNGMTAIPKMLKNKSKNVSCHVTFP